MIKPDNITALDIEIAVARLFNPRVNIIVPNITWGMGFNYELDMLVMTLSGYGYEIEIKTSRADLIADKKKRHYHDSKRIKYFYYALPSYLMPECEQYMPEYAGIIVVENNRNWCHPRAKIVRKAKLRNKFKFTSADMLNLTRLGAMRIWTLKRIIRDSNKIKYKKTH